jgi:hypothetical protein
MNSPRRRFEQTQVCQKYLRVYNGSSVLLTELWSNERLMNRTCAILIFFLSISFPAFGQRILYVDPAGSNIDGTSWAKAFHHLQDALAVAQPGDEIRVAKGIYKPDRGKDANVGDRNASFRLVNGVVIKGGYGGIGHQLNPDMRNIALYASIVSGDLGGNDMAEVPVNTNDNSYHVILGNNFCQ